MKFWKGNEGIEVEEKVECGSYLRPILLKLKKMWRSYKL
jgi:hypothetical protein